MLIKYLLCVKCDSTFYNCCSIREAFWPESDSNILVTSCLLSNYLFRASVETVLGLLPQLALCHDGFWLLLSCLPSLKFELLNTKWETVDPDITEFIIYCKEKRLPIFSTCIQSPNQNKQAKPSDCLWKVNQMIWWNYILRLECVGLGYGFIAEKII